jgi:hypothetical protein
MYHKQHGKLVFITLASLEIPGSNLAMSFLFCLVRVDPWPSTVSMSEERIRRSINRRVCASCWYFFRTGVDFKKQFAPYALNLRSAPIFFEQIYSDLASCICALRSTFCIFFQILGELYALRPRPNFYEIHPRCKWVQFLRVSSPNIFRLNNLQYFFSDQIIPNN